MAMVIAKPRHMNRHKRLLVLPNNTAKTHPLHKTLSLLACSIPGNLSNIEALKDEGAELCIQGWREATTRQYAPAFLKWHVFCHNSGENAFSPSANAVIDFVTQLYKDGMGYSAMNTARSAMSAFINSDDALP